MSENKWQPALLDFGDRHSRHVNSGHQLSARMQSIDGRRGDQ